LGSIYKEKGIIVFITDDYAKTVSPEEVVVVTPTVEETENFEAYLGNPLAHDLWGRFATKDDLPEDV